MHSRKALLKEVSPNQFLRRLKSQHLSNMGKEKFEATYFRPLTAHNTETDKITRINNAERGINLKHRVKSGNKHSVSQTD